MERNEVEELRARVLCAAVLEQAGFAVDEKESTRRAVKYRRREEIIIVIHAGKGWFDPLSDAKGDVFNLIEHLDRVGFPEALERICELVGFEPTSPAWTREKRYPQLEASVLERWRRRRRPWRGSQTWRYLREERLIPEAVIHAVIEQDRLREGPYGSMWAAHVDDADAIVGWEERGPQWRGFSTGGAKVLFRLGPTNAMRFCMTEAAIDAMSLAAIEAMPTDSLYLSTGGGWAPATAEAIRALSTQPGAQLVAATDNNPQGEIFADRIEAISIEHGCAFARLRPAADDWNDQLTSSHTAG